ncbi:TetR/AcrR family transcriptional regulator [Amycolatopsis benzoatilytica]|uniref:TetR/AcrR family transcriptional regulator n=1 Tax=Amycolatopsis benzoatilytica TaxID=346045 RepID=UPI00036B1B4B|nr:TetR/AcrR family transcriptional regulator [Amycolatopsis benzoatilytica]
MARAGLTVERLVAAAADMADEIGFDNLTVSAVARHFGVTVPSLYAHVRNIDELRVKTALLALEEMADQVADAIAGRSGKDALVAYAGAYRDYARAHPGRYTAARLRLDYETAANSAAVRHSRMSRALLRAYGLAEPEENHAVRMLSSTLHGFVSLEAAGAFDLSGDVEASWHRSLDVLDFALANWPGEEPHRGNVPARTTV